jgi:hypothetical protein
MITVLGEPLGPVVEDDGPLSVRIATAFPRQRALVSLRGVHMSQYAAFTDKLNQDRAASGLPPLTDQERNAVWSEAVDLLGDAQSILIRPNPDRMDLAFEADELLQEIVPKQRIRFLNASDPRVRDAINRRGEAWRINPLPRSLSEMSRHISSSRVGVRGRAIYYYNAVHGTRLLTWAQFASLQGLPDDELRSHLIEIAELIDHHNARGWPEMEFFTAGGSLDLGDLLRADFAGMSSDTLRAAYDQIRQRFESAVPTELRDDDPEHAPWRNRMYSALIARRDDLLSERDLLELGDEYFMQIQWLPGARIEEGELIADSVACADRAQGEIVHGLICNVLRENSDVEYINIGYVSPSITRRATATGRRDVYVAQYRLRGAADDELQMIRFHKWGVRERLDEGKPLLQAMLESEDYTDYIMDRRLACRQLGMNLPMKGSTHKVQEQYFGRNRALHGITIWSPYYQRAYIPGVASYRIPPTRLRDRAYARRLAELLGSAAAINLIVGRTGSDGVPVFDDGDEIVSEGPDGQITEMIVSDHTGAFNDYQGELAGAAGTYAVPITRRVPHLADPGEFAATYCASFAARLHQLQSDYRRRRRAFDALLQHRRRDPAGNLAHRWAMVLQRLDAADADALACLIRHRAGV